MDNSEVGRIGMQMLDILEYDRTEKAKNGIITNICMIHIAVEVEHEDENTGECWTEVYVQCDERRAWVKEAFLHRLASHTGHMQDIDIEEEEEVEERDDEELT